MGKRELEFKAEMNRSQLVSYLKDLAASLEEGTICVEKGDDYVVITPSDRVKVEIEASEKKDKSKFSLEIAWRKGDAAVEEGPALKISAVTPKAPVIELDRGEDDEAEQRRHGD
jgi:amphi-Trp domain-containing protein